MFDRAARLDSFRTWTKDRTPDGRLIEVCPARAPHGRKPKCNCPLLDQPFTDGLPEVPFPPGIERPTSEDDPFRRDQMTPGPLCTQGRITVDPKDLVMSWQEHPHRSAEWRALFAAGRNATERGHSHMKAGYGEGLDMPDRRGLRGRANAHLMAAFMLAAHAMRLMRSWLRNAERDDQDLIVAPPLKHRRGKGRRPWHSFIPPMPELPAPKGSSEPDPPPEPTAGDISFS